MRQFNTLARTHIDSMQNSAPDQADLKSRLLSFEPESEYERQCKIGYFIALMLFSKQVYNQTEQTLILAPVKCPSSEKSPS